MADFDKVTIFGKTTLSDLFKQIHKNNKETSDKIEDLVDAMKPLAQQSAGNAVMLMPTVATLIDINVKNNDQLVKMAAIVQKGSTERGSGDESLFDMNEIKDILEAQKKTEEDVKQLTGPNLIKQIEQQIK